MGLGGEEVETLSLWKDEGGFQTVFLGDLVLTLLCDVSQSMGGFALHKNDYR